MWCCRDERGSSCAVEAPVEARDSTRLCAEPGPADIGRCMYGRAEGSRPSRAVSRGRRAAEFLKTASRGVGDNPIGPPRWWHVTETQTPQKRPHEKSA